jgi:hypothetical protein
MKLTQKPTRDRRACNPQQDAILVSTSPLSSSEAPVLTKNDRLRRRAPATGLALPDGHQREAWRRINATSKAVAC